MLALNGIKRQRLKTRTFCPESGRHSNSINVQTKSVWQQSRTSSKNPNCPRQRSRMPRTASGCFSHQFIAFWYVRRPPVAFPRQCCFRLVSAVTSGGFCFNDLPFFWSVQWPPVALFLFILPFSGRCGGLRRLFFIYFSVVCSVRRPAAVVF